MGCGNEVKVMSAEKNIHICRILSIQDFSAMENANPSCGPCQTGYLNQIVSRNNLKNLCFKSINQISLCRGVDGSFANNHD